MLDYVVVYSMQSGDACPPIDDRIIQKLCFNPNKDTFIDYSEACYFLSKSKTRLAVFYAESSLDRCLEWTGDESVHFFDGQVLSDGIVHDSIAEFKHPLDSKGHTWITGNYCYGLFSDSNRDMIVGTVLGTYPIFWGTSNGLFIVSSNPHIIARILSVLSPVEYNIKAASWLLFHGYIGRLETLFDNIYLLPNNAYVVIDENNVPTFSPICSNIYDSGDVESNERLFDDAYTQYVNHVSVWGRNASYEGLHDLTGGYDSRTLLSAAVASGVHKNMRFTVMGVENSADVEVAKSLAARLSLDLEVIRLDREAVPVQDVDVFMRQVRAKLYGVAGLRGLGSMNLPLPEGPRRRSFSLNGIGAEYFRGFYSARLLGRTGKNESLDALTLNFLEEHVLHHSPADIQYFDKLQYLRDELVCLRMLDDTFALDHLLCLTRMPQFHAGIYTKLWRHQENSPNYNSLLHQYAFAIRPEMRAACNVNFRIIERACPELLAVPFAGKAWHPLNYAGREDESIFRKVLPVTDDGWQQTGVRWKHSVAALRDVLDSPPPAFWQVVDKSVYYAAMARLFGDKEPVGMLPFYYTNLAGIIIFLSDGALSWFDNVQCVPFDIKTFHLRQKAQRLLGDPEKGARYGLDFMLSVKPMSLLRK